MFPVEPFPRLIVPLPSALMVRFSLPALDETRTFKPLPAALAATYNPVAEFAAVASTDNDGFVPPFGPIDVMAAPELNVKPPAPFATNSIFIFVSPPTDEITTGLVVDDPAIWTRLVELTPTCRPA